MRAAHWLGAIALLISAACAGIGPTIADLEVSNGTTIPITLAVNGKAITTVGPGNVARISPSLLPPLPWTVEARTAGGRVLASLTVRLGDVEQTADHAYKGAAVRKDLSCGRLDIWSGPPLAGPAPGRGSPGDCDPAPSASFSIAGSCTKQIAGKLVDDFFAAWNARDASRVAGLFSSDFYLHDSVGGRARDLVGRDELQRYLTERFALGDRFSDLTISIPENPSPSSANPTVSFVRTANGTTYRGNAKLVCVNNMLVDVVMSAE